MMLPVLEAIYNAPLYHLILEGVLVLWVLRLLFRKSYNPKDRVVLTEAEKEELIAEWKPEPLVPPVDPRHPALHPRIVTGKAMKMVTVDGKDCLNFATHNYLGLIGNPDIEAAAIKCLEKYGVGSCGPRGFYGTTDVHLDLEDMLAKFMNCEEAVLYSYSFATIASAIPAYAKRGDIIFVDTNVNFAIQKGLDASRSNIVFFRHNDMEHLKELLEAQAKADLRDPKKAAVTRKFLIVEAIYMNSGDLCPLPELVELKKKYKLRFFVDECLSIGVLGPTGRGIFEYYDLSVNEADLVCGSLEYCLGSLGGFCVGSSYVVDHQRLSGLGYCFSASLPPLLAAGAMASLKFLESPTGRDALRHLEELCREAHVMLTEKLTHLELAKDSAPVSPIKHLYVKDSEDPEEYLQSIVKMAEEKRIAIVTAAYLEKEEKFLPPPSIRLAFACHHTKEDVTQLISVLNEASSALAS